MSQGSSLNRYAGLDVLKLICSFLVVYIHQPFPGEVGGFVMPLTRVAVPIFFMITGFFYSQTREKGKEKSQIVKILKLLIVSHVLYFAFHILLNIQSLGDYLMRFTEGKLWFEFLCLNESPFQALWYLSALLYTLILVYLWEKKWDRKKLYPLIPILLAVNIILSKFSVALFGTAVSLVYVRNFLFAGLPFFLLGDFLHNHPIKIKKVFLVIGTAAFAVLTLAEHAVLNALQMNLCQDLYISTIFSAISLFLLALPGEKTAERENGRNILAFLGRKCATTVYLLHPAMIVVLALTAGLIARHISIFYYYTYIAPIAVFVGSVIVALLWDLLKKKIKPLFVRSAP